MSERNVKVPPVGFILSIRASDNYVNGSFYRTWSVGMLAFWCQ